MVLDARATGTVPVSHGEFCCSLSRTDLPDGRIDALGIHEVGLYKLDEAVRFLSTWLPRGTLADPDPAVDADSLLPSSERSALVTVTTTRRRDQLRSLAPVPI